MNKEIKEKLFSNPLNNLCFDCSEKGPEWASVSNGVFLCKDCQIIHRTFGNSISQIKSLDHDIWDEISEM